MSDKYLERDLNDNLQVLLQAGNGAFALFCGLAEHQFVSYSHFSDSLRGWLLGNSSHQRAYNATYGFGPGELTQIFKSPNVPLQGRDLAQRFA